MNSAIMFACSDEEEPMPIASTRVLKLVDAMASTLGHGYAVGANAIGFRHLADYAIDDPAGS